LDFGFSVRGYEDANPAGISLNPGRVAGTDVIVLRFLRGTGVPVRAINAAAGIIEVDPALWNTLTESGVANPTMFGIADCAFADVFAAQAVASGAGRVTAPGGVDLSVYRASTEADRGLSVLY